MPPVVFFRHEWQVAWRSGSLCCSLDWRRGGVLSCFELDKLDTSRSGNIPKRWIWATLTTQVSFSDVGSTPTNSRMTLGCSSVPSVYHVQSLCRCGVESVPVPTGPRPLPGSSSGIRFHVLTDGTSKAQSAGQGEGPGQPLSSDRLGTRELGQRLALSRVSRVSRGSGCVHVVD